jgi:hypothetical protein
LRREKVLKNVPMRVTTALVEGLPDLRNAACYEVFWSAFEAGCERPGRRTDGARTANYILQNARKQLRDVVRRLGELRARRLRRRGEPGGEGEELARADRVAQAWPAGAPARASPECSRPGPWPACRRAWLTATPSP